MVLKEKIFNNWITIAPIQLLEFMRDSGLVHLQKLKKKS
jgi:hypothetical protein